MMRLRWWLALALVLAAAAASTGAAFPVTVTDALNRKVAFARAPVRILSLAPSVTEVLFALELDRRIVGVSDADDWPPEKVKTKPRIGGVQLNIERIVSLRPDLIIGMPSMQAAQLQRLIAMRLPVLAVDAGSIEETYAQITLIGRATGSDGAARRLVAWMRLRQSRIQSAVRGRPAPRVYVEISGEPMITAGRGTFMDDLIRRAGGANVFADLRGWPQVNAEAVIQRNPEVIVLTHPQRQRVLARRGWSQVPAIRSGRVVSADAALLSRPGPRIIDGLAYLARLLHPEVFP